MKSLHHTSLVCFMFVRAVAASLAFVLVASSVAHAGSTMQKEKTSSTKPTAQQQEPTVVLKTSLGDIHIQLHPSKAPRSVENFLQYVREGFYDGVIFHRVIPNFMVQTGGMLPSMQKKRTRAPVLNESINGLPNVTGSVAMARTNDPDSASSQFYINVVDNHYLNSRGGNPGYTVFATVTKGFDIAVDISKQETRPGDVPKETILIKQAIMGEPAVVSAPDANTKKIEKSEPIKTVPLKTVPLKTTASKTTTSKKTPVKKDP